MFLYGYSYGATNQISVPVCLVLNRAEHCFVNVRFTPESGHFHGLRWTSACDPKATYQTAAPDGRWHGVVPTPPSMR